MNDYLDTCIHLDLYLASNGTITAKIYDEFCVDKCIKPGKRFHEECFYYVPLRDTNRWVDE